MPSWWSIEDRDTASSPTAQLVVTSPKSMTPSGRGGRLSGERIRLSSVRSRCTACDGSAAASLSTWAQASAVAARTAARRSGSAMCPASSATTRSACRGSHWSTRSRPGCRKSRRAVLALPAIVPMAATVPGDRCRGPESVPPGRWRSRRATAGPLSVSTVVRRGEPSGRRRTVAIRRSGQAEAIRSAAASAASISAAPKAGFAIFRIAAGVPSSARSRKLASCWLPSPCARAVTPRRSAAMRSASAGVRRGAGRAPSVKKSIVRCSSGSMRGSSAGAVGRTGLGRCSDTAPPQSTCHRKRWVWIPKYGKFSTDATPSTGRTTSLMKSRRSRGPGHTTSANRSKPPAVRTV